MTNLPSPTPMQPPAIRAQMAGAPAAPGLPVTMQVAQQNPISQLVDPISMVEKKLQELKLWAMDFLPLAERVHPPLTAFMTPLANIGNAMEQEILKLRSRTSGANPAGGLGGPGVSGSPALPGSETVAPAAAGTPPGLA